MKFTAVSLNLVYETWMLTLTCSCRYATVNAFCLLFSLSGWLCLVYSAGQCVCVRVVCAHLHICASPSYASPECVCACLRVCACVCVRLLVRYRRWDKEAKEHHSAEHGDRHRRGDEEPRDAARQQGVHWRQHQQQQLRRNVSLTNRKVKNRKGLSSELNYPVYHYLCINTLSDHFIRYLCIFCCYSPSRFDMFYVQRCSCGYPCPNPWLYQLLSPSCQLKSAWPFFDFSH